jgi:hypothetical protein
MLSIQSTDEFKVSALHLAAFNGHTKIISSILKGTFSASLENGLEIVQLRDGLGRLPLHSLIQGSTPFNEIAIRILLNLYPLAVSIKNYNEETPLDIYRQRLSTGKIIKKVYSNVHGGLPGGLVHNNNNDNDNNNNDIDTNVQNVILRLLLRAVPTQDPRALRDINWKNRSISLLVTKAGIPPLFVKRIDARDPSLPPIFTSAPATNIYAKLFNASSDIWQHTISFL